MLQEKEKKKKPTIHLTLVSFAVTRRAYQKITDLFCKLYEEETGQPIRFRLSFGGSGTQVLSSAKTDVSCVCGRMWGSVRTVLTFTCVCVGVEGGVREKGTERHGEIDK